MKTTFYKNFAALVTLIVFVLFFLAGTIGFLVATILDSGYWSVLLTFAVLFVFTFIYTMVSLSIKVTFSEEGISFTRFKKEILFMKWTDITEVKQTYQGRGGYYLTFVAGENEMNIEVPTKHKYDLILSACPPNIRVTINSLQAFEYYHDKEN